jgi:hypothetical protein
MICITVIMLLWLLRPPSAGALALMCRGQGRLTGLRGRGLTRSRRFRRPATRPTASDSVLDNSTQADA